MSLHALLRAHERCRSWPQRPGAVELAFRDHSCIVVGAGGHKNDNGRLAAAVAIHPAITW